MNLKERYVIDADKANNGVEIKIDKAIFSLLYFGSDVVQLSLATYTEKFKLSMDSERAKVAAMNAVLVDYVVLGWNGLKEGKTEVKYSKENLTRLLAEYPGFGLEIMGHANIIDEYRRKEQKKTEKK